jgi:hypothetical protein
MILPELLQPHDTPEFAGLFGDSRSVAELAKSRGPRLFGGHAKFDVG